MPRKKKNTITVKYFLPTGSKEIIDAIVDNSPFYKNKPIWKQKFYHLCDHIANQNFNRELDVNDEYVNIHQEITAKILGINNQEIATMLKDVVACQLLIKDHIMKVSVKRRQGRQTIYIEEGKSFGYQFNNWGVLEEVRILDRRQADMKFREKNWELSGKFLTGLKEYREVLSFVRIDTSILEEKVSEVLNNKMKKKNQKEDYKKFMNETETKFHTNNNKKCTNIPFNGAFVPVSLKDKFKAVLSYQGCLLDGASVPPETSRRCFRTCQPSVFNITTHSRKRKSKLNADEPEQTTIARCKRALYHINNGLMVPSRKDPDSRVYTTITNLNRELRKAILLDGEKIIGIDIANSQPLIASILIKCYWSNINDELPADVIQYQRDCEHGIFYENFMRELNVPQDLRSQFKEDFFSKVFFSKVIERTNILKYLFIKRYPSCWKAICEIKGGMYNTEYNEFAILLQKIEANIIFDTVNMGLIKMGIKSFNIFDSIYVNDLQAFEVAKELTLNAFAEFGLTPTIRLEYREHLNKDAAKLQIRENHTNENQQQEMKKYTVDELLQSSTSKENIKPEAIQAPTKLQHLKLQTKEDMKTEQINKLTGKEIYDFVVAELRANGHAVNKGNVDYLTKIAREELGIANT